MQALPSRSKDNLGGASFLVSLNELKPSANGYGHTKAQD